MLNKPPRASHPSSYFRNRAAEVRRLAELSQLDEVRGLLTPLALQYQRLAESTEWFARYAVRTRTLAEEHYARSTDTGTDEKLLKRGN
jgi:hypothetical protein